LLLPLLPPAYWIKDIDPSSLEFLKSLATAAGGGCTSGSSSVPTKLRPLHNRPRSPLAPITPITTVHTATSLDITNTPVASNNNHGNSSTNKLDIHRLGADQQQSRLSEEVYRSSLLPVDDDNNDDKLNYSSTLMNSIKPARLLSSIPAASEAAAAPSSTVPPSSTDEQQQHRLLLTIIENQQRQMHELQIRLDAMGSMMARMEADVRYLCNTRQNQGDGRQQNPVQPHMEQRLRHILPGYGDMGGRGLFGLGGPPPPPPQQNQAAAQAENNAPHPNNINNNNPVMILLNNHIRDHPRGIFFPLFVTLFRFLFSLPHRLRTILQSTGPGRVYVHIRKRALELRAFDNIDLGSLMKLLIMLLIFTGRGNGGKIKAARHTRRNGRGGGGGGQDGAAAADAGGDDNAIAPFDMYSLLQWVIEYWNGHRMHLLILSSLIGYLVQVGLMSFLYKVLWLEREEVWKAWVGPKEEEEEMDANEVQGERVPANENREEVLVAEVGNIANPAENVVARPVAAPAAVAAGGIIRRGPNNGGFLYDVQCLIVSFLLSLIPAWIPEAIPEVEVVVPEAEQGQLPQPEEEQAAL
jgi:hypothetical protein